MRNLGIDLGESTIRLALTENGTIVKLWEQAHHARPFDVLRQGLAALGEEGPVALCFSGSHAEELAALLPDSVFLEDIPAIVEGVKVQCPDAGSIIEIGSQGSRFITDLDTVPRFAVNGHCAGGTGSFFEDQMSRLGLKLEDYSALTEAATSVPRLSGRCSVFAKTDIIHRQQEGVSTPDILLGLCYAMIRNYKAVIVRNLPVKKPVVFCGGVTRNEGVCRAIPEVFNLNSDELIIPENAPFTAALGAAHSASGSFLLSDVLHALSELPPAACGKLAPLNLHPGTDLREPATVGIRPEGRYDLGIDIGSTSTDLVLIDENGAVADFQYLRTSGDPEAAVRQGLQSIRERFGEIPFHSVGVTGSGRERIGRLLGADAVRDEITAQAIGARTFVPEADTVFEIGGQDSKFIRLTDGEVSDFQMNKICAAGTGSFVEEQASRMGIPIADFGPLALTSSAPVDLGERCTVFIGTAIASAAANGQSTADIAAGLCYSIVKNYLHKVVAGKPIGQHIVLQGGVAYNPGIVAAFQAAYPEIKVNPCFPISGAYGAAVLACEAVGDKKSTFLGYDFPSTEQAPRDIPQEIQQNIAMYNRAGELLLDGYSGKLDPSKKTVGVPYVLMIHKFFPMANAFFTALGYNVLLTHPTDEDTIALSQAYAGGETCYPVKLIYGHMKQLIDAKVDYIFLPTIHTMKHPKSHVAHNYGCVYMQTAPVTVARNLNLEGHGITLLSPVFDLDFGKEAMAGAMVGLGKILGKPKPICAAALLAGAKAVRKHGDAVEEMGRQVLDSIRPEDKVLVLITRNYGVSDPILNMGIPQLLLQRGYKVITLSHLPAHDLDIHEDHTNLYWPFGQHIISGAKIIAHHPNLYAVYLTNHGCGPDSMLSHLFKQEMGDKPYLQIEVDEHFSKVGVITRIEAFLNALNHRPAASLPQGFDLKAVTVQKTDLPALPAAGEEIALPDFGAATPYLVQYLNAEGWRASSLPAPDDAVISLGRSHTSAKEYLPFAALTGSVVEEMAGQNRRVIIPQTRGSEADGQYARVILAECPGARLAAPTLENILSIAPNADRLLRALVTGDVLYAAPAAAREELTPETIPTWEALEVLAKKISALPQTGMRIGAVGTPLCETVLNESILDTLDCEGNAVLRAPLSEALLFLQMDNEPDVDLKLWAGWLKRIGAALGSHSSFSENIDELKQIADSALPGFAGGNGRYRYAKAVQLGKTVDALLELSPRYENTSMVLELRGLATACPAPLTMVALDHDWDDSAWSRLRSFLYYCR